MRWTKWVVGSLLLVAVLLTLNLIMPRSQESVFNEAFGQNRPTAGGDYVMAAGRTSGNVQLLYVVDTRVKKMGVFTVKRGTKGGLMPIDVRDLNKDFLNGFSGQVILQPFQLDGQTEGMAVVDTVNKKMIVYASSNSSMLSVVGAIDLGIDLGT